MQQRRVDAVRLAVTLNPVTVRVLAHQSACGEGEGGLHRG